MNPRKFASVAVSVVALSFAGAACSSDSNTDSPATTVSGGSGTTVSSSDSTAAGGSATTAAPSPATTA